MKALVYHGPGERARLFGLFAVGFAVLYLFFREYYLRIFGTPSSIR